MKPPRPDPRWDKQVAAQIAWLQKRDLELSIKYSGRSVQGKPILSMVDKRTRREVGRL